MEGAEWGPLRPALLLDDLTLNVSRAAVEFKTQAGFSADVLKSVQPLGCAGIRDAWEHGILAVVSADIPECPEEERYAQEMEFFDGDRRTQLCGASMSNRGCIEQRMSRPVRVPEFHLIELGSFFRGSTKRSDLTVEVDALQFLQSLGSQPQGNVVFVTIGEMAQIRLRGWSMEVWHGHVVLKNMRTSSISYPTPLGDVVPAHRALSASQLQGARWRAVGDVIIENGMFTVEAGCIGMLILEW